jgi:hypothetical protein
MIENVQALKLRLRIGPEYRASALKVEPAIGQKYRGRRKRATSRVIRPAATATGTTIRHAKRLLYSPTCQSKPQRQKDHAAQSNRQTHVGHALHEELRSAEAQIHPEEIRRSDRFR